MGTITRLLTGEFYTIYAETAKVLGQPCSLHDAINYERLTEMHARWLAEYENYLDTKITTPNEKWDHLLATLAVELCACECVVYEVTGNVVGTKKLDQELLIEFPAIYTGLQFVKDRYIEFRMKTDTVLVDHKLSRLNHERLRVTLTLIRDDHRKAANFPELLNLPR